MADIVDRATRSRYMAGIKGRDTKPELIVRSFLHRAGLRFTLNNSELPGRPDIVLPRWKTVVFVHGCFWHRHRGCRFAYTPKTNRKFWTEKLEGNVARDKKQTSKLRRAGLRVLTVWECDLTIPRLERLVRTVRGPSGALTRAIRPTND